MKSAFIALTIILTWFNGKGQLDSSVTLLSVIDTYKEGHTNGKSELVQKAVKDCKTLISIFEKNNDIKNLAKAKTLFGQILVENGNYPLAKSVLTNALDLSNKVFGSNSDESLNAKKYLSWSYGYMGDLDTENKYSQEILLVYKRNEEKYKLKIADLYNTIGINFGLRNNHIKEREYFFFAKNILDNYKLKNLDERKNVQEQYLNLFNSLSLSYINSLDFENTIYYAKKSLAISEKLAPNSSETAATYVVLARCYTVEKQCDSAIFYINQALNLLELNNLRGSDLWLNYRSFKVNILARCDKAEEAKSIADSSIKIAIAQGNSPEGVLSQLLVLNQNTNAELSSMEDQFREKEKITYQKHAKERILLIAIVFALILVSGLGFVFHRLRQNKREIEFQRSEIEKSLIENSYLRSRMDPHFVSNCIRSVLEFVNKNENKKAAEYLDKFQDSMRGLVHNSSLDLISLSEELKTIERYLELEKPRITNNLEWKIDVDSDIDLEEVELPPLILQTFVENCVKHGINGIPRIGQIKIVCKKAEGRINITIEDNGTGVDLKYKNEGSQGLKLTRDRLAMFTKINNADASLEIHNLVSGTKVVISFNI